MANLDFIIDIFFKVSTFISLLFFYIYGETKTNKKGFKIVVFSIFLLWIVAWIFFSKGLNYHYIMVGELFVALSFYLLYEVFDGFVDNKNNYMIFYFLIIYLFIIMFLKNNTIIISTLYFILLQIFFKLGTYYKITKLRFRLRLEKFYKRFFYISIFEDIVSFIFILGLINAIERDILFMFWNLAISIIVLQGAYLFYKIKAVL